MDARPLRLALTLGALLLAAPLARAAEYRTPNFIAIAPTEEFAKEVAFTAERWRVRLAKEWLGQELPKWFKPCPIQVNVGSMLGAGGSTTFNFDTNRRTGRPEVFGWDMKVQGTRERILDSVIPHEVSHTIFASHFRRPLPRWADEGAATLAEHDEEQRRQDLHLKQVWNSHKIPLKSLLAMTEYPREMRDVMTLYAQGYSLADYLVQKRGKSVYLQFLDEAETIGWEKALRKHYEIEGVEALEGTWGNWVLAGSPDLPKDTLLADAGASAAAPLGDAGPQEEKEIIRAQSDDSAASEWASPAPVPPVRTALVEEMTSDEFLPPQSPSTRTAAAPTGPPAAADGKEPRPAPLGAVHRGRTGADSGATETSSRQPSEGRQSLPRTTRIEASALGGGAIDFFGSASDESTGAPGRMLGMTGFPGR